MVSGRSVAASRKMGEPGCDAASRAATAEKPQQASSSSARTRIFTRQYSWGPTPSPLALSWSAQGWPSLGLKTAARLSCPRVERQGERERGERRRAF